uniref:Eosinophil lineage-specific marker n=1 Tax=Esox lucius TaxID=8010 RepID=A0A6Q2YT78_ESOLU
MGVLTMFLLLSAAFSLGDLQLVYCKLRQQGTFKNAISHLDWSISYCFTGPHRCNRGWHQFGSRCFRFEETLRSWTEAERHCQSLGGHLASVHSWKESRFLKMLTVGSPLTWIGGNDGGRSWSWTDGSGFNYHEWAQGEPNNYNGVREPCIQINFGGLYRWNDEVCEKNFASVCSRRH